MNDGIKCLVSDVVYAIGGTGGTYPLAWVEQFDIRNGWVLLANQLATADNSFSATAVST
jgi:hypothetical protein